MSLCGHSSIPVPDRPVPLCPLPGPTCLPPSLVAADDDNVNDDEDDNLEEGDDDNEDGGDDGGCTWTWLLWRRA